MRGAGRPIWDDIASAEDLAALSPPARELPSRVDVLVVGGGVIGLAIAAFCTGAGLDVLLVEQHERLARGPSGRAAGGLSPDAHPELGPRWRDVARRSLDLHRELDERFDTGVRPIDIHVSSDVVIAGQAHVDPLRMCAALARYAGTFATSTTYDDARSVVAKDVVFATGTAPDEVAIGSQSWVKGHLVATEPTRPCVDGFLAPIGNDVLVLQLPTGHVIAGGTKEPGIIESAVDDAVAERIASAMTVIAPETGGLAITHRWTCFRPLAPDSLPVVRRVRENVWCAAGLYSTGILMAPVIGDALARAIVQGADLPEF
jgi:glycine/D-amino acid oxidase-like deaminating enzyme